MAQILIPFGPIVDDTGALVAGATVDISSVKSPLDDTNIAGHGATVVASADGLRVGVLYDVAAKGEAWITLAVSKAGSTITGVNQYPVAFAAADSQTIASRASQASLDTVDDFLDTEIAAIKAKTDNLPSDPADASVIAGRFDALDTAIASAGLTTDQATLLDRIAAAAGVGLGATSDTGWQQTATGDTITRVFPLPGGGTMTQTATKSGNTVNISVTYEA